MSEEQLVFVKPKDTSLYSVLLRPNRIYDGVTPPLKNMQSVVGEQARIFSIRSKEELDEIIKDFGPHLDSGNMAVLFEDEDSDEDTEPTAVYVWNSAENEWQIIKTGQSDSSSDIDGGSF